VTHITLHNKERQYEATHDFLFKGSVVVTERISTPPQNLKKKIFHQ